MLFKECNFDFNHLRFLDDIEFMTNVRPGWYWIITLRYLGPLLNFALLVAGLVNMGRKGVTYAVWNKHKVRCMTLSTYVKDVKEKYEGPGGFTHTKKNCDRMFDTTSFRLELYRL